jgi:hypothetical protein
MLNTNLFIHEYEESAFEEMRKELRGEDQFRTYYEDYVLTSHTPDLYGKTVRVSEKQFKSVFDAVLEIADYLDMPMPEIYVFESFYYTVESKGTNNHHWIEISSKTIADFTKDELVFLLAKELAAIKLQHTHYYSISNEFLKTLRNKVSFTGINTVAAILKVKMYHWTRISHYTSDNFAYLWCGDLKTCFNAITKTVLNDIFLAENINISEYLVQAERINSLKDPIHRYSKTDESVPYVPFRLKSLIAYAASSRGVDAKKYMAVEER